MATNLVELINENTQELVAQAYAAARLRRDSAIRYGNIWRTFAPAKQTAATTLKALFAEADIPAAPVVQFGSTAPDVSGQTALSKLIDILPTEHKVVLDEKTIIDLNNSPLKNEIMFQEALNQVIRVMSGVEARLDFLTAQALSRGAIILDNTNNYGGTSVTIEYPVPTDRKVGVANAWSNSANAKPLDDIVAWVDLLGASGAENQLVMYMDSLTWKRFISTEQFKSLDVKAIAPSYEMKAQGVNAIALALYEQGYPLIKVVPATNFKVHTTNGIAVVNAWKEGSVLLTWDRTPASTYFTPYAEDVLTEPADFNKVKIDNILVKTYQESHGITQVFEAKANAIPVLDVAMDCVLANTENTTF